MVFDTIIAGGGPAGITAAIYAARKKSSCLLITKDIGGQTLWSGNIENYTGWQFVTGPELVKRFEEHLNQFEINISEPEEITNVEAGGGQIKVTTDKSAYECKTVVIATGKKSKELDVPGEKEFKNRGVQYCATCDAPLFAGKDVAVAGGGNSALDAALQLVKIARSVILINNTPSIHGDIVMLEKAAAYENLKIYNNTSIKRITGSGFVNGITVERLNKKENIAVQGVFIEIGLVPNSSFIDSVEKNDKNEIIVNCFNETSLPGVFAAGDVTSIAEKQIIIAAGEGAKAFLSAYRYNTRRAA